MLNEFYNEMDHLLDNHKVYKLDVIGDAYMVLGGCPDGCTGPEGAERVARFALDVVELVSGFVATDGSTILVRAGLHTGPLVAGVIGTRKPQYTVFGDTGA